MKYYLLFFLFSVNFLAVAQGKCNYFVSVNAENLKETGKFKLVFRNTGEELLKIPKEISVCNMKLENFELFNEKTQQFERMELANKDVDCFKYEKQMKLRSNKSHIYEINFKDDLQVLEYDGFFEKFNTRKYRFKISFYFEGNQKCDKYNNVLTDWIYKN